jgi:hypothetical protein
MRLILTVIIVILGVAVPASAQAPACEQPPDRTTHPYGLDPYKPSDAALLRDAGATLVAQTPLQELRRLDPYKPSEAALLRELGGAFPLWGLEWYWGPPPAPLSPFSQRQPRMRHPDTSWRGTFTAADNAPVSASQETTSVRPSTMATLRSPESNDGVWIEYGDRRWILDGRPVPYDSSAFQAVGHYGTFQVFKRSGVVEDVIYVPARQGELAAYRLKR